ncbi:GNAT family N-acetyltransferase [Portibacter lacus]|uniref:Ribosomal-protein-alanine acetyltransferase n=1 Tax=Portibacter lacus TaxID=1099794 RepID=A0AA37SQ05_9BACT|nr:GNAT family N-acetyltransferase [Portibacter lacus]GLR16761.1 putative ribosomal-protein-alanine acetyltransferase [Portibacter lacus]
MNTEYRQDALTHFDFIEFHQLFDRNRDRLKRYFPNTVAANETLEDSLAHLIEADEQRRKKEKYLFGVFDSKHIIAYVNVKNIEWDLKKCEIGYFIDQAYEGKGIMTEQIRTAVRFCFDDLGMNKVFLRIAEENIGSKKVAQKLGFVQEGMKKNGFRVGTGEMVNVEFHIILKKINQEYEF